MSKLSLLPTEKLLKELIEKKYQEDKELCNLVENIINYREHLEQEISIYCRIIDRLENTFESLGLSNYVLRRSKIHSPRWCGTIRQSH